MSEVNMKDILRKIDATRQSLTTSVHIIQGHLRLHGRRMPDTTSEDLKNVVKSLNERIEELYQVIRDVHRKA